ncbi:hypothetical protein [Gordonia soli]|uniref:Uncharacterized protein n=1 Tax=Gordonia soli NBRC 108243 TaxID=1223545 RepID=M0QG10_9ACTN|nr:hypothetical protein [Gordonia soli]GAC66332.1 hypothetical protein GS4_02_00420 [Gordonia soli NBRC 108243]
MTGVEVDPEVLRSYATKVSDASTSVSQSGLPSTLDEIATCMPGSSTSYSASTAAPVVRGALRSLGLFYYSLSTAVTNSAGEFQGTDDEIAGKLRRVAEPK